MNKRLVRELINFYYNKKQLQNFFLTVSSYNQINSPCQTIVEHIYQLFYRIIIIKKENKGKKITIFFEVIFQKLIYIGLT